jgi:GxxExxY protein
MTENEIASQVVDAACKIHTTLGPGLLESVYEAVLAAELTKRGLGVVREQAIPVDYEGIRLEVGYRADLIVEGKVLSGSSLLRRWLQSTRNSCSPICALLTNGSDS